MRVVRAFRIPITVIITALALSGCMRTTGPVAVAPQGDLDSMAYGQPNGAPPPVVAADSGGGAIGALRAAFAAAPSAAPPPVIVAAPVAYVEPVPVRHDAAYHLDAGDKLRVVVYGQEGLTNTYAVSAGGSITMPLIGSVPARGRTTAGLAAEISAKLRAGFHPGAVGRGGDRSVPAVLHSRRGRSTRAISLCAEHDGRERGRDRRRLLAARAPRQRHGHPHRCVGNGALRRSARQPDQSRRYRARQRALVLATHFHQIAIAIRPFC